MSLIDIDWNPNRSKLRQFALIWFSGFVLVGLLLAWRWGCFSGSQEWRVPLILWILAAVVGLLGLCIPLAVKPIYKLWMAITFPIGWLLSHTVLAIIYFGLFTLVGVVFRLIGRDTLDRHGRKQRESYWIDRPTRKSAKRYFQQF